MKRAGPELSEVTNVLKKNSLGQAACLMTDLEMKFIGRWGPGRRSAPRRY